MRRRMMNYLFAPKKAGLLKSSNPFTALQNELNRVMSDFTRMDIFEDLNIHPKVDIVDDKDFFKVEAEMSGMGEEDIKVNITDGVLNISGEKRTSRKDKDKNYMMREITYGNYQRQILLPDSVDTDKASASFRKGMLWVSIPKKMGIQQQTHDIPVVKE